jgi:hypothetical protein
MKVIYLTEEAKAEIEAKIAEIETGLKTLSLTDGFKDMGMLSVYKEILSSATILPVEESWEAFDKATNAMYKHFKSTGVEYPNGVIIQPKQEKL